MIGAATYPDLTTCETTTPQAITLRSGKSVQWAGGFSSFFLNRCQLEALKGLLRVHRLQENWDGEGAEALTPRASAGALALVHALPFEDLPSPHVVPTSVGGVQFEWDQDRREIEIEVLPDASLEFLQTENGAIVAEGPVSTEGALSLLRWLRNGQHDEIAQG